MWDKVKAFFQKKAVRIASWCVLAVAVVSLIIGGATKADIDGVVVVVVAAVAAVGAVFALISSLVKED